MSSSRRTWDSFEAMRQAAHEGDPQAQCYLGVCYQTGQGVAQDNQEAVKWFRRAAEQSDPVAQCYLGVCYLHGAGCAAGIRRGGQMAARGGRAERSGGAIQSGRALRNRPGRAAKLCRSGQMVSRIGGTRLSRGAIQPGRFLRNRPGRAAKLRGSGQMVSARPPNRNVRPRNAISACVTRPDAEWNKIQQEAVKWFIRAARQGDKTAQHNLGLHYASLKDGSGGNRRRG